MPLYSRSDNWASKLVIVLQFTAWISVGIVLLQKGVTSLRSQSTVETNSNTQETNDTTIKYLNEKTKRTITDEEDLSIYITKSKEHSTKKLLKSSYSEKENDKKISEIDSRKISNINEDIISDKTSNVNWFTKDTIQQPQKVEEYRNNLNDSSLSNKTENYKEIVVNSVNSVKNNTNATTTTTSLKNDKKKRARMSSGAAAAIAMVAVGAAMLVVGPMVIALRALDKRRQERRYLKSLKWNDQPPTYEQATLMTEVPRYSTLNLNITVHNSSSCVPTPSACLPLNPS